MSRPVWKVAPGLSRPLPAARRRIPWRVALAAVLAGLLVGCAGGAIRALDALKDHDARGDWATLAAEPAASCPRDDALCGQRQALRARGCARLADGNSSETARRGFLDCAVESGRAAIGASAEPPRAWREAYALALFNRRQVRPGREACQDNAPLRNEADALRAAGPEPLPRFLAASARLTAVARGCGVASPCAELSEARALLRDPPPESAAQWPALAAGVEATARRQGCG